MPQFFPTEMLCVVLEHFWPYNPNKLDKTSPPSKFEPEAAKYPLIKHTCVTGDAAGICSAIAAGYYVSIGTPLVLGLDGARLRRQTACR